MFHSCSDNCCCSGFVTGIAGSLGQVCSGRSTWSSCWVLQPQGHLPHEPNEGITEPHPQPGCHHPNRMSSVSVPVTGFCAQHQSDRLRGGEDARMPHYFGQVLKRKSFLMCCSLFISFHFFSLKAKFTSGQNNRDNGLYVFAQCGLSTSSWLCKITSQLFQRHESRKIMFFNACRPIPPYWSTDQMQAYFLLALNWILAPHLHLLCHFPCTDQFEVWYYYYYTIRLFNSTILKDKGVTDKLHFLFKNCDYTKTPWHVRLYGTYFDVQLFKIHL